MICFQKFFLQYLSQLVKWKIKARNGCDLLSKVLFTIFVTAWIRQVGYVEALWFAFKSSFYNICHSAVVMISNYHTLWFAFKSSFYNICHSSKKQVEPKVMLWFAFKSSFYNICHSKFLSQSLHCFVVICFQKFFLQYLSQPLMLQESAGRVVICFQKFFLQYLSQHSPTYSVHIQCCDLLSKVLFTIFVTAHNRYRAYYSVLWFAFKSSFYNICHSLFFS